MGRKQVEKSISKIRWSRVVKVDPIGLSRGIGLLWKGDEMTVDVISVSNQTFNDLDKDNRKCR